MLSGSSLDLKTASMKLITEFISSAPHKYSKKWMELLGSVIKGSKEVIDEAPEKAILVLKNLESVCGLEPKLMKPHFDLFFSTMKEIHQKVDLCFKGREKALELILDLLELTPNIFQ
mmetsp:Transcript_36595/g.32808  ORF Transcript_36595/g.32808 Transcript_36595/m.32808 type:complete len:117 (+) Transcript_36595:619-969(+)